MTPPKRWPKNAEDARVESLSQARRIDRLVVPILDGETMTHAELMQRAGQICRAAQVIVRELASVGPKVEA